ncbi:hypothetical protein CLV51_103378 [Chitinophaga niastensis]|uniref:Uncharacterized protein n=1 Tax=Chitinophaga niastensis TaxID=536980 RepID=A0A2P8HJP9_CHINA|nr:hypothetical protein CLV51_103378 [Chitinophaga niastensis]
MRLSLIRRSLNLSVNIILSWQGWVARFLIQVLSVFAAFISWVESIIYERKAL